MDGTPQLLTDVKFTQQRKGYDPDEVDNYLERINAAVEQLQDKLREVTKRAETADAKVAEARRLQAEAEAAREQAEADLASARRAGGAAGEPAGSVDDELKKVLLLAQRAADQAVEEANATAEKTVGEARTQAVSLLAEAERERDRLLAKARRKADAAAEERARELRDQVSALETARGELQSDVDALRGFLDGERDRLRDQLGLMARAVDDPRALGMPESPELHDPVIPAPDEPDEPVAADPSTAPAAGDGGSVDVGGSEAGAAPASPTDAAVETGIDISDGGPSSDAADPGADQLGVGESGFEPGDVVGGRGEPRGGRSRAAHAAVHTRARRRGRRGHAGVLRQRPRSPDRQRPWAVRPPALVARRVTRPESSLSPGRPQSTEAWRKVTCTG